MSNLDAAKKLTWAKVMSKRLKEELEELSKLFDDNTKAIEIMMDNIRDNYDMSECDITEEQKKTIEELNEGTFTLMARAIDTVECSTIMTLKRLYEIK